MALGIPVYLQSKTYAIRFLHMNAGNVFLTSAFRNVHMCCARSVYFVLIINIMLIRRSAETRNSEVRWSKSLVEPRTVLQVVQIVDTKTRIFILFSLLYRISLSVHKPGHIVPMTKPMTKNKQVKVKHML